MNKSQMPNQTMKPTEMFPRARLIGLVLLWCGFLWLCFNSLTLPANIRPVVGAHFAHLPKEDNATITAREMRYEIHDVAVDLLKSEPSFVYPGVVMLIGGLLIAARPVTKLDLTPHLTKR